MKYFLQKSPSCLMGFYPITQTITVKNASDTEMDVTSDNPEVILVIQNGTVIAALNTDYILNKLTVHVQEGAYTGADTSTTTNISGKNVTLYPTATTETTAYGTKTTDTAGDAVFEITQLSFSKTVTGELGEKTREFSFTIQADDAAKDTVEGQTYTAIISNEDETIADETSSVTFDDTGKATLTLEHGESAVVKYLPTEVSYTVTEDNYSLSGYTTTVTDGTTTITGREYTIKLDSNASNIAFTNNRDSFIPTAIDIDGSSFNAIISVGLIGLAGILVLSIWKTRYRRTD